VAARPRLNRDGNNPLIGNVPVGPDGRESELVEGEPFKRLNIVR
jgi:hypothetical protein